MKLTDLVQYYSGYKEIVSLVEETCELLQKVRIDYGQAGDRLYANVRNKTKCKIPTPEGINCLSAYEEYYKKVATAIKQHYQKLKDNNKINIGDKVRTVKATHRENSNNSTYFFGVSIDDIPIGSEWTVIKKTSRPLRREYDYNYGYSHGYDYETVYYLDTNRKIKKPAVLRGCEIQKVTNVPTTLDGYIQEILGENNLSFGDHVQKVADVLKRQMGKTESYALQHCIYTISISIFPGLKDEISRTFPKRNK